MICLPTILGLTLVTAIAPPTDSAAEFVMLRDGTVVIGLLWDAAPRSSTLSMVVRRAWAEAALPELARRWEADEAPKLQQARDQRRRRLEAWRTDRKKSAEPNDRVLAWIDREIPRLSAKDPERAPLMIVTINRSSIRGMVRRPVTTTRLLQWAWRLGFRDAETLPLKSLKEALAGRGISPDGKEPLAMDDLLPILPEEEPRWRARRAATEVLYDQGLRFLRFQTLIVPEPAAGQPINPLAALSAVQDLARLLEEKPVDPIADKLRTVGERGRMGAVLTEQVLSPDLSRVSVELTLWVRNPGDQWVTFGARSATVRTDEIKADDAKNLEDDPQVQTVLKMVQALGLGEVPADVKRRSLSVGAAVQKALAQARTAFQDDLARLALPIEATPKDDPKP